MTAKDLHRLNDALDANLERIARKAIAEGLIKRQGDTIFFKGEELDTYAPIFHRLLDEEEEAERWERLGEKL